MSPANGLQDPCLMSAEPAVWPDLPSRLSPTSAEAALQCPRQWSLRNAIYPDIWQKSGYPRWHTIPEAKGVVIHRVVQVIAHALSAAGCMTVSSEKAVQVLADLGGLSRLMDLEIETYVNSVQDNPRCLKYAGWFREQLKDLSPMLSLAVKQILRGISFDVLTDNQNAYSGNIRAGLSNGVHTEVYLRSADEHWHGYADSITIKGEYTEISEMKTGEPREEHIQQIRLYAFMYETDSKINPNARVPISLTLSYSGTQQSVDFEIINGMSLKQYADYVWHQVQNRFDQKPPPAQPSSELCGWCDVRHLCEVYWDAKPREILTDRVTECHSLDAEVELLEQRGTGVWRVMVLSAQPRISESSVLVDRGSALSESWAVKGSRLRVLNASVAEVQADEEHVLIIHRRTEVFVLPHALTNE
jgi:hypothetical protein